MVRVRFREDVHGQKTVGHKSHAAICYVWFSGPAPSRNRIAKHVGPHGSQQYGYQTVHRVTGTYLTYPDASHPRANPHGCGAICLTKEGARYIRKHMKHPAKHADKHRAEIALILRGDHD